MIGDTINIKPEYKLPAKEIGAKIINNISKSQLFTISISGESGSGKSTLSYTLKECLEEAQLEVLIFHMDDYFHLPPKDNHAERELNIERVGPGEVNLELINNHINLVKDHKIPFQKPLVHYQKNTIEQETIDNKNINVIIVEGTYANELNNIDLNIFIDRNFEQTKANRYERSRDVLNVFNEQVLALEHDIIKEYKKQSDIIITSEFEVNFNNRPT